MYVKKFTLDVAAATENYVLVDLPASARVIAVEGRGGQVELYYQGEDAAEEKHFVARAFGVIVDEGSIDLPGDCARGQDPRCAERIRNWLHYVGSCKIACMIDSPDEVAHVFERK